MYLLLVTLYKSALNAVNVNVMFWNGAQQFDFLHQPLGDSDTVTED